MDLKPINSAAVIAAGKDGGTLNAPGSGLAETKKLLHGMAGMRGIGHCCHAATMGTGWRLVKPGKTR